MPEPTPKLVLCPECDKEMDINKSEDCPNCGHPVAFTLGRYRSEKALQKLRDLDEKKKEPEKKKGSLSGKLGG